MLTYHDVFDGPAADQTWFQAPGVKVCISYCQDILTVHNKSSSLNEVL